MSGRRSIAPTYDSRETGPRYTVETRVDHVRVGDVRRIPDPFVRHEVTVSFRDALWCLVRRGRVDVTVLIGADRDLVDDVLELDADTLIPGSTRRAEFDGAVHAALAATLSPVSPAPVTTRAADEHDDRPAVNRATPAAGRSSSGGAQ